MDDAGYRTLRPGRLVVIEYRPDEELSRTTRGPQPMLSWAIYLGERFGDAGPQGWFGLPDGSEISDGHILWHFIPLGPSDHPEAQAAFLRRLRLRAHQLRSAHPQWFRSTEGEPDLGN